MGLVIYSASPFEAFRGAAGTIAFLFVLGVAGVAAGLFKPGEGRGGRISLAAAGGLLLIASVVYGALALVAATGSTQSVLLNLDDKRVVEDNCNNGRTCTRYVLESNTGTTAYVFNVSQDAYEKAQVATCYQITYYPSKAPFSDNTSSFQQIENVARIQTADPARCQ